MENSHNLSSCDSTSRVVATLASNNLSQPKAGSPGHKTHGDENPHEANDPLATADTDDGPHGASLPHKRAGQLSKHVEASAPWLRRQVNDIDPQECGESQAHNSHDVPEMHGGFRPMYQARQCREHHWWSLTSLSSNGRHGNHCHVSWQ